jgi:hypothetical protein
MSHARPLDHPSLSRRAMLQAGSIGLLGLGMNHLAGLQTANAAVASGKSAGKAKACIYIFLSGGLAQHESFDMKPDAGHHPREFHHRHADPRHPDLEHLLLPSR